MNALDRKLCAVFKLAYKEERDTAQQQFQSLLEKVSNPELSHPIRQSFSILMEGSPATASFEPTRLLDLTGTLRNSGMIETSAFLFCLCLDAGAVLDREKMLQIAPNAAAVEHWRKKNKIPAKDFQKFLLAEP